MRALANGKGNAVGYRLTPGESFVYTCTATSVTAGFTNSASVSSTGQGVVVGDSDDASVILANPAIAIGKSPELQGATGGVDPVFTVTVVNTGDVDLRQVTVADDLTPDCALTAADVRASLNGKGSPVGFRFTPDEWFTFTCSMSGVTAGFTNTAVASGWWEGVEVTDADDASVDVATPGISIAKTPDSQTLPEDGNVTFTITVVNTGDVDLRQVSVADGSTVACARTAAEVRALLNGKGNAVGFRLTPNETFTYKCNAVVAHAFINTASADGMWRGLFVDDSDIATVDAAAP